jgi:hypothetical protein
MAAIEAATLLKLIVELIGTVGGLIQTSIRHGERLRGIHQQLVAMKEGIERGQVQNDAKLTSIAASVGALRDEMLNLVAEEMEQQREERAQEFEQFAACVSQWINATTRPLYYAIAALGGGVLILAAEVMRLAVQLPPGAR